jgi:hypothetical protein
MTRCVNELAIVVAEHIRAVPQVVPDATYPGMWRVRWPDRSLSDLTNLARAKDAAARFMESEERRQRGRQSPSDGRLCVKTDSRS